jgi:hypothetical protein
LDWVVSVVVVVTGPGTVVCSDEVVVLVVGVVAQEDNDSDTKPATRDRRISFFMGIMVVWIVTVQSSGMITLLVGHVLWGVDLTEGCPAGTFHVAVPLG